MDFFSSTLSSMLFRIPGLIIALSFHEFAHAFAAHKMGDDTAKNMGRMTLNPIAHLDPFGAIALLLFGFGWAKPVPVNPSRYRGNIRVADIVVSLAGVTMNLLLAIVFTFLYVLLILFGGNSSVIQILVNMLSFAAVINVALLVFNLIPVPPLDGSHVLESLLIRKVGPEPFIFMKRNSLYFMLGVILISRFTNIIGFAVNGLFSLLLSGVLLIFGI